MEIKLEDYLSDNEIKEIANLFWETMGWKSQGNKIINKILAANESLIEAKVKEIFKPFDKGNNEN